MNYINLYRFIENSTKIDFVTPHRVSFARINKIIGYIKSITLPFCPYLKNIERLYIRY